MATHETLAALFTDTADAIREKTGDTAAIVADNFPDAIRALSIPKQFSDIIVNADTLQVTGTHATTTYFKSLTPVVKGMGTNGEVMLSFEMASSGLGSVKYYIDFVYDSLPTGAKGYGTYAEPGQTASPQFMYITGLTGRYTMTLNARRYSSSYYRITVGVTVTAA